jgi:hypothetical protein
MRFFLAPLFTLVLAAMVVASPVSSFFLYVCRSLIADSHFRPQIPEQEAKREGAYISNKFYERAA